MKQFLHKRWHSIPVGIISAVMVVSLVAGGVLAAYTFLTATLEVEVEEAIAIGMFGTWDNLDPYGSVDDVDIGISGAAITIATTAGTPYGGEGFTAGEWIVLPVNIRNASSGSLNLSAIVTPYTSNPSGSGSALALECSYEVNDGKCTGPMDAGHEGVCWARNFKAAGAFGDLDGWSKLVDGNSGFSGSAVYGANVLFIKISAPGDVVPGTYAYTITLARS